MMKYCPKCQTNYADETYEFCLQDGTLLVNSSDSPTVFLDEQPTQIKSNQSGEVQFYPPTQAQDWQSSQVTQIPQEQLPPPIQTPPPPQKSNSTRIVFLTALAMVALFGAVFGAWYFINKRQPEVAENKTPNTPDKPTATRTPTPKSSATATPTPTPTPEIDTAEIKSEITGALGNVKTATENGDIESLMSNYANSVSFYGSQKSKSAVRKDKEDAFNKYDSMEVSISDIRVTPDASGEKATAVFDKQWSFIGEKVYEGKVQSQFQFVKSGGKWLITSEKDLKIYYVNK